MIVPNKFTTLDRSLLAKCPNVLKALANDLSLHELYAELADSFEDPGEFVMVMDMLFVLGRITINDEKKVVIT